MPASLRPVVGLFCLCLIAPAATAGALRLPAQAAMADSVLVASDSLLSVLRTRMAGATPGRPLRVVHLGDSHSENGRFGQELAGRLAKGGPIAPAFVTPYSAGLGLVKFTLSGRWRRSTMLRRIAGGPDGPSGSSAVTTSTRASMRLQLVEPAVAGTRLTLWWTAAPGTTVRLRAGSAPARTLRSRARNPDHLDTASVVLEAGTTTVTLEQIRLPRRGALRIGGFTIDRPDAAVTYDLLGLGGSTQAYPLRNHAIALDQFLASRQPDLVVIWFGTNSVVDFGSRAQAFETSYTALVRAVRTLAPQAVLVLLGPPDFARPAATRCLVRTRVVRGKRVCPGRPPVACGAGATAGLESPPLDSPYRPVTNPYVAAIRDLERTIAAAAPAMFFDVYRLQGEARGMERWYCAKPALAASDLVHLSGTGYREVARALMARLEAAPAPVPGQP